MSDDNCICGLGIGDPRVSRHSPLCDEFRSQKATINHLTAELTDLRMSHSRLVSACKNLTGSLWPQNETTEKLREVIEDLEGEG